MTYDGLFDTEVRWKFDYDSEMLIQTHIHHNKLCMSAIIVRLGMKYLLDRKE